MYKLNQSPITSFSGKYRFLSNFYPSDVILDKCVYPTVEHAYQAAKTDFVGQRNLIQQASTPGGAKRLGRMVSMRPEFVENRIQIMLELVRQKFGNPALRDSLMATCNQTLIEGNTWNDRFWGQCPIGVGRNELGTILMKVREEIRERRR